MSAYADTSILVSLLSDDALTPRARSIVRNAASPIFVTDWQMFEWENAMALRAFRGQFSPQDVAPARAAFLSHVESGLFIPSQLPFHKTLQRATKMAKEHTAQTGTRTFDIFHVASALELNAKRFLTLDDRQGKLARLCGLPL